MFYVPSTASTHQKRNVMLVDPKDSRGGSCIIAVTLTTAKSPGAAMKKRSGRWMVLGAENASSVRDPRSSTHSDFDLSKAIRCTRCACPEVYTLVFALLLRQSGNGRESVYLLSVIGLDVTELAYRFDQSPRPYAFCVPESLSNHYRPCIFKRQAHTKTQPRQQSPCSCPRLLALVLSRIPGGVRRDMMEDCGPNSARALPCGTRWSGGSKSYVQCWKYYLSRSSRSSQ